MTNNQFDEFEQENLDAVDEGQPTQSRASLGANLSEAWRTRPLFKLFVIMASVVAAIVVSLSLASGPAADPSKLVVVPAMSEAPGGSSSPNHINQTNMASDQRVQDAMQNNGSAMPTPVGSSPDISGIIDEKNKDPLNEFREETKRLQQQMQQERQQNAQQIQVIQQQIQQPQAFDDSLAQAMQRQMSALMESWNPRSAKVVPGMGKNEPTVSSEAANANAAAAAKAVSNKDKILVPAGTVSYGQLITEANSDVPGPILAQILSGPFSGARVIGSFQTQRTHLIMSFSLLNHKGKDYPVQILALNPNTTLGGMASEIDERYFDRVVLPAAASFMQAFGSAIGEGETSTTISNNAVIVDHAKRGVKDGVYSGIGQVGQSVGQFLQEQAGQTKRLIRVAAGTPMAMFFLSSARENDSENTELLNASRVSMNGGSAMTAQQQAAYNQAYGQGTAGYNNPYASGYNQSNTSNANTRTYSPSSSVSGYGSTTYSNQSPYSTSYYGR